MAKTKEVKRAHDAGTGKYVPKEYAEKHPKTTVTITEKAPAKKK